MNLELEIQANRDRQAIIDLVNAYAYCADTRNAQGQMALFTVDTNFEVYYDPKAAEPTQVVSNREDLFPIFDNLNTYDATMHFNGQSTITLTGEGGNKATGITYCMAHHLTKANNIQNFMVAAIRYEDVFTKQADTWLFAERKLFVEWIENR